MGCCTAADAQTPSPLPEWEYSAGQLMRIHAQDKVPDWSISLGPSVNFQPKYVGASQYHLRPGIDVRYKDIWFFSGGEGLGINALHGKSHRVGMAITYDLGRHEKDDAALRGVGSLRPAPEVKFFAEYLLFPVTFRADIRHGFGGYNGWVGDFSIYTPIAGSKKYKYFVFFGPTVTWADKSYFQSYWGIDPTQAAKSGYRVYHVSGGMKDVSLGLNATWFYYKQYFVNLTAGGSRLLDDAADSPLAQERVQGVVNFTLGYNFRIGGAE
jgi:outer membrane scaffolding protein for murein synthesis (MipA/OmpV family)